MKNIKIFFFSFLFFFYTYITSCPTCIGYPKDNSTPFFEQYDDEIIEIADNQTSTYTCTNNTDQSHYSCCCEHTTTINQSPCCCECTKK